jgi:hypothetical protein
VHSSFALSADGFAVERDGAAAPLAALWPGGFAPDDRLAVLLNEPMDPVGCSNLICGTTTLFYDHLRETRGPDGFFRYADNFLVGVGVAPGDFNQLDVWPPHKVITVPPDDPERLLEALTDRRVTLLAVPEAGLRCRGPVVLSTWNALLDTVRCVVAYAPDSGRARDADLTLVGNPVVESYVEQAIFSTPGVDTEAQAALRGLRRALDRASLVPAEAFRVLPDVASARELLGVTEVLPPGHQR